MTTTEYRLTAAERVVGKVKYGRYRFGQAAWRNAAHLLPPRLKYLAAIDLVAGVAANDAPDVRAMEAIGRYGRRHQIEPA